MNAKKAFAYLWRYPLSIVAIAVICWGSLAPLPKDTLPEFRWSDKVAHILMYLVLCGVIRLEHWRAHRELTPTPQARHRLFIGALLLPMAMGGLLELAQEHLTAGRSGDWFDFAANSLGCLIAAIPSAFRKHSASKDK